MGAETFCAFYNPNNGRCDRQERLVKRVNELSELNKRKPVGEFLIRLQGLSAALPSHVIDLSKSGKIINKCRDIPGGGKVTPAVAGTQRGCSDFDDGRSPTGLSRVLGKR